MATATKWTSAALLKLSREKYAGQEVQIEYRRLLPRLKWVAWHRKPHRIGWEAIATADTADELAAKIEAKAAKEPA